MANIVGHIDSILKRSSSSGSGVVSFMVTGWLLHEASPFEAIYLGFDKVDLYRATPVKRKDLTRQFALISHAESCGFQCTIQGHTDTKPDKIYLTGILSTGEVITSELLTTESDDIDDGSIITQSYPRDLEFSTKNNQEKSLFSQNKAISRERGNSIFPDKIEPTADKLNLLSILVVVEDLNLETKTDLSLENSGKYEVLVIDNNSNIALADSLEVANINRIVSLPERVSTVEAFNIGAKYTRGDLLVLANIQQISSLPSLSAVINQFEIDPELGILQVESCSDDLYHHKNLSPIIILRRSLWISGGGLRVNESERSQFSFNLFKSTISFKFKSLSCLALREQENSSENSVLDAVITNSEHISTLANAIEIEKSIVSSSSLTVIADSPSSGRFFGFDQRLFQIINQHCDNFDKVTLLLYRDPYSIPRLVKDLPAKVEIRKLDSASQVYTELSNIRGNNNTLVIFGEEILKVVQHDSILHTESYRDVKVVIDADSLNFLTDAVKSSFGKREELSEALSRLSFADLLYSASDKVVDDIISIRPDINVVKLSPIVELVDNFLVSLSDRESISLGGAYRTLESPELERFLMEGEPLMQTLRSASNNQIPRMLLIGARVESTSLISQKFQLHGANNSNYLDQLASSLFYIDLMGFSCGYPVRILEAISNGAVVCLKESDASLLGVSDGKEAITYKSFSDLKQKIELSLKDLTKLERMREQAASLVIKENSQERAVTTFNSFSSVFLTPNSRQLKVLQELSRPTYSNF